MKMLQHLRQYFSFDLTKRISLQWHGLLLLTVYEGVSKFKSAHYLNKITKKSSEYV